MSPSNFGPEDWPLFKLIAVPTLTVGGGVLPPHRDGMYCSMLPVLEAGDENEVQPVLFVVFGTYVSDGRHPLVPKQLWSEGKLHSPMATGSVGCACPRPEKPAVAVLLTVVCRNVGPN